MPRKPAAWRVVLDTNTVISATLFGSGALKPLRLAWQAGHVVPILSAQTRAELLRVLAYKKFNLKEADIARVLALYLPHAELNVQDLTRDKAGQMPICRDPTDPMFLELAQSATADILVSGDQDLLVLANTPNLGFRILKPIDFLAEYATSFN